MYLMEFLLISGVKVVNYICDWHPFHMDKLGVNWHVYMTTTTRLNPEVITEFNPTIQVELGLNSYGLLNLWLLKWIVVNFIEIDIGFNLIITSKGETKFNSSC